MERSGDESTLAVLGAAGRTGRHVVAQALDRGLAVRGLARDANRLEIHSDRLTMVEGDARDVQALDRLLAGADAVISVLAPTSNQPEHEVAAATRILLARMAVARVDRLVLTAGAGVRHERDRPGIIDHLIRAALLLMARNVYSDMEATVEAVRASGLEWTVVRVPRLTDGPVEGAIKAGYLGQGVGAQITRGQLARFLVESVISGEYVHRMPVVSS